MPGIRRQARVIALQTLYEYDTVHHAPKEVLQRHAEERHLQPRVTEYAYEVLEGVCGHLTEIDAHIQSAAREWPLQQMARIDKNILRLAIYEILFNNTVPAKAAINEAVELAKLFGSDTSSRFVNGVLGTIFNRAQQQPIPIAESEVK
ncbi:MAG: transcription antitermination factor NusB [Chloroflexi bacterium]|nr:transcription antitermination factor NusB [Ktedonobacteraceae bacterium]MBV9021965.1 transcription antitermination factor NusB [Ktedonobacteraceae bacterium]MBV9707845.1 transcription antitermination factor NusB [Chloroflexota bacterium]